MCDEGEAKTTSKDELHNKKFKSSENSQEGDQSHDKDEKTTKVAESSPREKRARVVNVSRHPPWIMELIVGLDSISGNSKTPVPWVGRKRILYSTFVKNKGLVSEDENTDIGV